MQHFCSKLDIGPRQWRPVTVTDKAVVRTGLPVLLFSIGIANAILLLVLLTTLIYT